MTNYVITTKCGTKIELQDSRVHELKGKLKELRLQRKAVVSLIVQTGKG